MLQGGEKNFYMDLSCYLQRESGANDSVRNGNISLDDFLRLGVRIDFSECQKAKNQKYPIIFLITETDIGQN